MIIACQVCQGAISDTAIRCPKCHALNDDFLGQEVPCSECSAPYRPAFDSCGNCGAPRSVAGRLGATRASEILPPNDLLDPGGQGERELPQPDEPQRPRLQEAKSSDDEAAPSAHEALNETPGAPLHAPQTTSEPKKSNVLGRALAGVVAAVVAGAIFIGPKVVGVIIGATAVKVAAPMVMQASDAQKVAEIWPKMEADPTFGPFFRELKGSFPSDYKDFQETMTQQLLHGKREQDRAVSFAFMERFGMENGSHVATASDSALIELADAQLRLTEELKAADVPMCAQYSQTGRLSPEYDPTEGVKLAAANLTVKTLRAIGSGKRSPSYRSDPTPEQAEEFWGVLGAQVEDQRMLDAFANDTISSLGLDEQCELGLSVVKALVSLPKTERAYWAGFLAKESFKLLQEPR